MRWIPQDVRKRHLGQASACDELIKQISPIQRLKGFLFFILTYLFFSRHYIVCRIAILIGKVDHASQMMRGRRTAHA